MIRTSDLNKTPGDVLFVGIHFNDLIDVVDVFVHESRIILAASVEGPPSCFKEVRVRKTN